MSAYGLTYADVTDWIREQCKAQGISIAARARKTGINIRTLRRYLRPKKTCQKRRLDAVVKALGGTLIVEYDIILTEAFE